jgi:hypothetical protein
MLSRLIALVQEKVENRYYGKYRGLVESNEDGTNAGRLLVKVPAIMGEKAIGWAMPCFPYGGGPDRGLYLVPEKDDGVWVEFEAGNIAYPIWSGAWHAKGEAPKGVDGSDPVPAVKLLKSRCGHIIQLDDTEGKENITIKDGKNLHLVVLDKEGIKVTDGVNSGQEIVLDGSGIAVTDTNKNKITMDPSGIKVTDGVNSGQEIVLDGAGITVTDTNKNKITMDSSGIKVADGVNSGQEVVMDGSGIIITDKNQNKITMDSSSGYPAGKGITLNGTKRICLEGLIDWLETHQHVGNLGIPTPLFPADLVQLKLKTKMPEGGILSDTVKIK